VRLAVLLFALSLSACAPAERAACNAVATREIAFTGGASPDIITARSFGEACVDAIGLITVTTAEGAPVWAWTAPLHRAFGDNFIEPEREAMHAFLERWTEAHISTTTQAPEWALLAPGQTTLDALTYEDVRARNLPMLCHYAGTARQACVFWEPAAGGAGHLLDRDIDEGTP
jgi:hypothetical protein